MIYSSPVSAPLRQADIDAHRGTRAEFLVRYSCAAELAARLGKEETNEFLPKLIDRTADSRNLRLAWDWQARRPDVAAGPDGWRPDEFSEPEIWDCVRRFAELIATGRYRRGEFRTCDVPKGLGRPGTRRLVILNLGDRVVQRAVLQIVQPLVEPTFDPHCFGGRPGLRPLHALAQANVLAQREQRLVWVADDVKDCFEHIPHMRLLDIVRRQLGPELTGLIRHAIHRDRGRGLDQGAPLATLLANSYLDHFIDRKWRAEMPGLPLLRFVDDLLALCGSREQAEESYQLLERLMRECGLKLKATPAAAIRDLSQGEPADWLGYRISYGPLGLEARLPPDRNTGEPCGRWLASMREHLLLAHEKPDSSLRACRVIEAMVDHAGPCFPFTDKRELYGRACSLSEEIGFSEVPCFDEFLDRWKRAWKRWCRLRRRALKLYDLSSTVPSRPVQERSTPVLGCGTSYVLHTDGCCLSPGRLGGWAFHLRRSDSNQPIRRHGSMRRTTNNRAELMAVIKGLGETKKGATITIRSDSEYVVLGIGEYLRRWKANGWRSGTGGHYRPLKNVKLWKRLDSLLTTRRIRCEWVRGHSGSPANEDCDRRAELAARGVRQE